MEIYTDVDGIKTADPRIVPEAQTLSVTTYDEIVEMAHQGAKVIHPRAVEIAMRRNLPLRVKSTFDDSPGTLITYSIETTLGMTEKMNGRVITGITHLPRMAQLRVLPGGKSEADMDLRLFRALADVDVDVDLVNVSPQQKSFIVPEGLGEKAARTIESLGFQVQVNKGCAKVSIIGSGMRGVPGVMASMVEALHQAGVSILQTADSHVTISCLVRQEDMEAAVRALHAKFGLDRGAAADD